MVGVSGIPTLDTPRLRLRPHRLDDFDSAAALYADPEVNRHLGGVAFTREQSWLRFIRYAGLWYHLGFGYFVIEDRETGAFVGECGFLDLHRDLTPSIEGSMEAGWALHGRFQGRGLAAEAVRACLAWARQRQPQSWITAIIDPDNVRSLRLAARLGFIEFARGSLHGRTIVMFEQPPDS